MNETPATWHTLSAVTAGETPACAASTDAATDAASLLAFCGVERAARNLFKPHLVAKLTYSIRARESAVYSCKVEGAHLLCSIERVARNVRQEDPPRLFFCGREERGVDWLCGDGKK